MSLAAIVSILTSTYPGTQYPHLSYLMSAERSYVFVLCILFDLAIAVSGPCFSMSFSYEVLVAFIWPNQGLMMWMAAF